MWAGTGILERMANDREHGQQESIARAAEAISRASALLIGAGAGMGVDSGLPDFRGDEGFWRSYPPFRHLGLSFEDMADPRWFGKDPERAWGFYGHRRNLYRKTVPHAGFAILLRWGQSMSHGCRVYTSNVDGQFQRAGFAEEQVLECHGAIDYNQCAYACTDDIWPAEAEDIDLDEETFRARGELPRCPQCGFMVRPNILMFGDAGWLAGRTRAQTQRYRTWLESLPEGGLVKIECGAGTAIPSVRYECERRPGVLIRINPREPQTPRGGIGLAMGALAALTAIDTALADRR